MNGQDLLEALSKMSPEDLGLELTVFGAYGSMGGVGGVSIVGSEALHSKVIKISSNICSG